MYIIWLGELDKMIYKWNVFVHLLRQTLYRSIELWSRIILPRVFSIVAGTLTEYNAVDC